MLDLARIRSLAEKFGTTPHPALATIKGYEAAFRRFWATKILDESVTDLRELEDLDPVIRMIDSAGKRRYTYEESSKEVLRQRLQSAGKQYGLDYRIEDRRNQLIVGGPSIARSLVTQKRWYQIFKDIKSSHELKSKLTELFQETDSQELVASIDELRKINENRENRLMARQGIPLNAFLFCYNMDHYTSVFSLRQRVEMIRALELGSLREDESYGSRIVNSNSQVLSLNEKLGTNLDTRTLSSFLYTEEIREMWEPSVTPDSQQYLILRAQDVTTWEDKEGEEYHFGSNVANNSRVKPGTSVIFDSNKDGVIQFTGQGRIATVTEESRGRTTPEGKAILEKIARLDQYERFANPLPRSNVVAELLDGLESYNIQHSIRVITKQIFDQIVAESKGVTLEIPDRWKELVDLLDAKKCVILFGPPGTGKTFAAEETATQFVKVFNGAEEPMGYIRVTQFHPSYSYEDFIEGITIDVNATDTKGQPKYLLKNGIFKELCVEASKKGNQSKRFVLIIDEINRGNIPKIFGELLYALERRGREILLPYSGKLFTVPSNIYIIGTMNTADKSIALLDVALRRRFVFKEMMPDEEQVPEVDTLGFSLRTLLSGLNERIVKKYDRERQIGHTYFIGIRDLRDFRIVWFNQVIPLLQEYFYGDYKALAGIVGPKFVDVDAEQINNDISDEELREAIQELYQTVD